MGLYHKGQFFKYVIKETSVSSPERGSKNLVRFGYCKESLRIRRFE